MQRSPLEVKFQQEDTSHLESDDSEPVRTMLDKKKIEKVKKVIRLPQLTKKILQVKTALEEKFQFFEDAIKPNATSDTFSTYCSNKRFKELLAEKMALAAIKLQLQKRLIEINENVTSIVPTWASLIREEALKSQTKIQIVKKTLEELFWIKQNILDALQNCAKIRFEEARGKFTTTTSEVFINEFGSVTVKREGTLLLDKGFGHHSGRQDNTLQKRQSKRQIIFLDKEWLTNKTLIELRDLINNIIRECKHYHHYQGAIETEIINLIHRSKLYFSYNFSTQEVYCSSTQLDAIFEYSENIKYLESNLQEVCRVPIPAQPIIEYKDQIFEQLEIFEKNMQILFNGLNEDLPACITSLVLEIDKTSQAVINQIPPFPDLKKFEKNAMDCSLLLTQVTESYGLLAPTAAQGEVDSLKTLIKNAKDKWALAKTDYLRVIEVENTCGEKFDELKQSIEKSNKDLEIFCQYYGNSTAFQAVKLTLAEIEKQFYTEQLEKNNILKIYAQLKEQFLSLKQKKPNYSTLIELANSTKIEKDFSSYYQQTEETMQNARIMLDQAKAQLELLQALPETWVADQDQLEQLVVTGAHCSPVFASLKQKIKDFIEQQNTLQSKASSLHAAAQQLIQQANLLYQNTQDCSKEEKFVDKLPSLYEQYEKLLQIDKTVFGLRCREERDFSQIEEKLNHTIDLKIQKARQIKKTNKIFNKLLIKYFQAAVEAKNLEFWKKKQQPFYCGGKKGLARDGRISHTVFAMREILKKANSTNTVENLKLLKTVALQRKKLPYKNCYYRCKYWLFKRDPTVTQLINSACAIDVDRPDLQAVKFLLPKELDVTPIEEEEAILFGYS